MIKTLTGFALIALSSLPTQAQAWPDKPVKVIVPYATETQSAGSHPVALVNIGSLTVDSDFTVFMRKEVPEDVRRAALRRLWVLMRLPVSCDELCYELCYEPQAPASGLGRLASETFPVATP